MIHKNKDKKIRDKLIFTPFSSINKGNLQYFAPQVTQTQGNQEVRDGTGEH